jgi:signal transduction histidine kinase
LCTVQQEVHAAARPGFAFDLPKSGHFDGQTFWSLRKVVSAAPLSVAAAALGPAAAEPAHAASDVGEEPALATLYDATSHLGVLALTNEGALDHLAKRIWRNLVATQERFWLQQEGLVRSTVALSEQASGLDNVLRSTDRVAIVGYRTEGGVAFANTGFYAYFGFGAGDIRPLLGQMPGQPSWAQIEAALREQKGWTGPVRLVLSGTGGSPKELLLSVTESVDREGNPSGYTLVFSDFSGEEERIRSEAIRVLLEHVGCGLCRVDAAGRILPGYSRCCEALCVPDSSLVGSLLPNALGLSKSDGDILLACLEQAFHGLLTPAVSLAQLPIRMKGARGWLSLECAPVLGAGGQLESVLFTLSDVSALQEAEAETRRMRGLLNVLRARDPFERFVQHAARHWAELERAAEAPEFQADARRALHTAKGVFAQYGITEMVETLHWLEERPRVSPSDLAEARCALEALLELHAPLWRISLGEREVSVEVGEAQLLALGARAGAAQSVEELRGLVQQFVERASSKRVDALVGLADQACRAQAAELRKFVRFRLQGGGVRVPLALTPVFEVLPHLFRNAVDHGIELPELRESAGKSPVGTIELSVARVDGALRLCVADDGAGILVEPVTARAIALGLLSADAARALTRAEQLGLIFEAGLSTAARVTTSSGRGIGMAAVRAQVHALGGTIQVESEFGNGTRCVISLPIGELPLTYPVRGAVLAEPARA